MSKKTKILLAVAAGLLWTAAVFAARGFIDAGRIRILEEEKRFLIMWIDNRHGPDWARRVGDWASHKAEDRAKRFSRKVDGE